MPSLTVRLSVNPSELAAISPPSVLILTDEAGIYGIDPFVAIGIDKAALVRHHEGPALADGDDGRADFDFDGHCALTLCWVSIYKAPVSIDSPPSITYVEPVT